MDAGRSMPTDATAARQTPRRPEVRDLRPFSEKLKDCEFVISGYGRNRRELLQLLALAVPAEREYLTFDSSSITGMPPQGIPIIVRTKDAQARTHTVV